MLDFSTLAKDNTNKLVKVAHFQTEKIPKIPVVGPTHPNSNSWMPKPGPTPYKSVRLKYRNFPKLLCTKIQREEEEIVFSAHNKIMQD